jgi:hypothetical protein
MYMAYITDPLLCCTGCEGMPENNIAPLALVWPALGIYGVVCDTRKPVQITGDDGEASISACPAVVRIKSMKVPH